MNEKRKKPIANATMFITFMGIVSLLSDMTHEGASGISGAYLTLLGASGTAIGFVSGMGTLIGYGLRLLTGYIADKKKNYWVMTIVGYAIDLLLIPFLALVPENGWLLACGLILAGKVGNAIKKPAKDTMVSFAASEKGEGRGFAILEFVDQIGAFLGPTILFFVMLATSDMSEYKRYCICFAVLAVPALACVALLFASKRKFPHPDEYEKEKPEHTKVGLKKAYIVYVYLRTAFRSVCLARVLYGQPCLAHRRRDYVGRGYGCAGVGNEIRNSDPYREKQPFVRVRSVPTLFRRGLVRGELRHGNTLRQVENSDDRPFGFRPTSRGNSLPCDFPYA